MFISDNDVAEIFRVSRVTIWRWVKRDPTFPRPLKLSPGTTRWRLADIEAWTPAHAKAA